MADPLYEYLCFYRDLGFTDLYLPEGFQIPQAPGSATTSARSTTPPADASGAVAGSSTTETMARKKADPPVAERAGRSPSPSRRPTQRPASPAVAKNENPLAILQEIQTGIGDCRLCRLHEGRAKIVFGSGNPNAQLIFVGEGPGADEDAQGFPFVGRAGQLLTQMINGTAKGEGIAISRDDVYICNVVKCRPPGNRTPEPDEMATCGQFLVRQLEAIRPKAICVLGATAARYLLETSVGITKLRGEWQDWRGIPVMPTYHPSFLLRPYAQDKKRESWEDLKKLLHFVYDGE